MKRFIFITTQFEALHRYKKAPEEVYYLSNLHRHKFHVKVIMEVFANDREIEFIIFQHNINDFIDLNIDKVTDDSCETMAEKIYMYVKNKYGLNRSVKVELSEDNENGAIFGDII